MAVKGSESARQPLFGAAVVLAKAVKLNRDAVLSALREVVGLAGARVRLVDDKPRGGILSGLRSKSPEILCEIAGVKLSIAASARPLGNAAAVNGFINPAVWRGTVGGLTKHRAHVLVAEAGDATGTSSDAMFDRATAVTLATAAIANLIPCEGVIWLPARNAVPMGTFGREMERFIDGQAPLDFWLRWQLLPAPVQAEYEFGQLSGEALNSGVSTIGLSAFIGAEIVAPPSSSDQEVMLDHIFGLASAAIDENTELKDGAVFGKPGEVMVRLNKRESGPYSDRPYWELLPRPAPARTAHKPDSQKAAPEASDSEAAMERRLRLVVPNR